MSKPKTIKLQTLTKPKKLKKIIEEYEELKKNVTVFGNLVEQYQNRQNQCIEFLNKLEETLFQEA